jgi:hypothetical protein
MKKFGLTFKAAILLTSNSFACTPETIERQGLAGLMKTYLAALVANDPSAVPFDRYVKYTQNTAEIPEGYGLWETAFCGPSEFQVYAAGPFNQQVAGLVMMKKNSNEDIMKLKTSDGEISVPAYQGTFNMTAIHFFKIKKGKIYDIEATGLVLQYGTKTGWEYKTSIITHTQKGYIL